MSRKRKDTGPKQAFTAEETSAVFKALGKLYRRNIHYLVEPRYPRPSLAEVWHGFIPQERWEHMARAQAMMVMPNNSWQYFAFFDEQDLPGEIAKIEIKTERMLPNRAGLPEPVIPDAYLGFAGNVYEVREQWIKVWDAFSELNKTSTRLTAAYHWPCAGALMALGGQSRHDLTEVTRPGHVGGSLAVRLRDTSSFVMQHMLLPAIDNKVVSNYEGNEKTGLAARLVFQKSHDVFGSVFWPMRDNEA